MKLTTDTPADRAAAQYTRAVGRMRRRQYEALDLDYDLWRDLCQEEDRLARYARQETGIDIEEGR